MRSYRKLVIVSLVSFVTAELMVFLLLHVGGLRARQIKQDTVTGLNSEYLVFPSIEGLPHYYETKSNTTEESAAEFLSEPVRYTYNSDGLHEDTEYSIKKPAATFRIVTLGDSFTFGQFVNTDENWTEVLEQQLAEDPLCPIKHVEIINLAQPGYDVEYATNRFITKGTKYRPDAVIWFIPIDRWNELSKHIESVLQSRYTESDIQQARRSRVYYLAATEARERVLAQYEENTLSDMFTSLMERFTTAYDGPLMLVTSRFFASPVLQTRLRKTAQTRPDTVYVDTIPNLDQMGGLFPDYHPNTYGHRMIAESIHEALKQDASLFCEQPM